MSKEQFIVKKFSPASLATLDQIVTVVNEYSDMGYTLSLRQLYYQLVARDFIPNNLQSYKRIGDLVSNARLAGLIDWDMIEDRGRETITPPMWDSPGQIVRAAANQFAIDRWADQSYHVEVMVEKAALEGVLIPVCRELGIRFTANRGYSSQSAMYEAGKRIARKMTRENKNALILYLGDHDPSGIDMTRDVLERLGLFARADIEVNRLALNFDQVEQWQPPENFAKMTDSRAAAYVAEFGESSWELDAVDPATLGNLVRTAVAAVRDDELYNAATERETRMRNALIDFAESYQDDDEE